MNINAFCSKHDIPKDMLVSIIENSDDVISMCKNISELYKIELTLDQATILRTSYYKEYSDG